MNYDVAIILTVVALVCAGVAAWKNRWLVADVFVLAVACYWVLIGR